MATFTKDLKYRGEGNSSLVIADTVVSLFSVVIAVPDDLQSLINVL